MRLAILILLTATISANAAEQTIVRANRISFGPVHSGQPLNHFMLFNEKYKVEKPITWVEFARKEDEKGIWAPSPTGMPLSLRALGRMTVVQVAGQKIGCNEVGRLVFIQGPVGSSPAGPTLFAYEHNICDKSGLVDPDVMVDQYIAKYGVYDGKDFDRNMIIYNNVQSRFRIGVRQYAPAEGPGGVTITIVDDSIFKDKYFAWRSSMKVAREASGELF